MPGLTPNGFDRKTLSDILDSLAQRLREDFGEDFNTGDDSVAKQIYGSIALELDELWQANQEAYQAYTLSGAEGVHLDNYFNLQGVTRLGAMPAGGPILIETDRRLPSSSYPLSSRQFTTESSPTRYTSQAVTLGNNNTFAYRLTTDDLLNDTVYTATLVDDNNTVQTLSSVSFTTDAEKQSYLSALSIFLNTHSDVTAGKTSVSGNTLRVGINLDNSFNILLSSIDFNLQPAAGLRYGRANIEATEPGQQTVTPLTRFRANPAFPGFVRALTYEDFNPGRDVETDAEFRVRGAKSLRSETIGTYDAIIQQLNDLPGVRSAVIYENVSNRPTQEVPQSWSYHVVVAGGVDAEIGRILHTYSPLNVAQYGTTIVNVINTSGGTSPQKFSNANTIDIDIRVSYRLSDGGELTQQEQDDIVAAFLALHGRLKINSDLQNFALTKPVLCSLTVVDRLEQLTVETKLQSEPDTAYSTDDVTAGIFDIIDFSSSNIIFRRV